MTEKLNKYNTGFSSGALLFKEADAIIHCIKDPKSFMNKLEVIDFNCIPVNSEASKKRLGREVTQRLQDLKDGNFIQSYLNGNRLDKLLILFYAACKKYQIIADFMLDSVLSKWYNLDFELTSYDFQSFVYKQIDKHPELENLTPITLKKLSQVVIRMLNELGLLKDNKLQKLEFNHQILKSIVMNGDSWFLEILLLNEAERKEIIER